MFSYLHSMRCLQLSLLVMLPANHATSAMRLNSSHSSNTSFAISPDPVIAPVIPHLPLKNDSDSSGSSQSETEVGEDIQSSEGTTVLPKSVLFSMIDTLNNATLENSSHTSDLHDVTADTNSTRGSQDIDDPELSQSSKNTDDEIADFFPIDKQGQSIYDVISVIVGILGLVGNGLSITVWTQVKHFNATTFQFVSLAVYDMIFIVITIAYNFLNFNYNPTSQVFIWAFRIINYLFVTCIMTTANLTILLSFTRFIAVRFPLKARIWFREDAFRYIFAFIVVFSTLTSVLTVTDVPVCELLTSSPGVSGMSEGKPLNETQHSSPMTATPEPNSDYVTTPFKNRSILTRSDDIPQGLQENQSMSPSGGFQTCMSIFIWTISLCLMVVPWLVIVPINFLLVHHVRGVHSSRKEQFTTSDKNNYSMDIMVIIITLLSAITYPMFFILAVVTIDEDWDAFFGGPAPVIVPPEIQSVLMYVHEMLMLINSSTNFIFYYVCGQDFRNLFSTIICGKLGFKRNSTNPKATRTPNFRH